MSMLYVLREGVYHEPIKQYSHAVTSAL